MTASTHSTTAPKKGWGGTKVYKGDILGFNTGDGGGGVLGGVENTLAPVVNPVVNTVTSGVGTVSSYVTGGITKIGHTLSPSTQALKPFSSGSLLPPKINPYNPIPSFPGSLFPPRINIPNPLTSVFGSLKNIPNIGNVGGTFSSLPGTLGQFPSGLGSWSNVPNIGDVGGTFGGFPGAMGQYIGQISPGAGITSLPIPNLGGFLGGYGSIAPSYNGPVVGSDFFAATYGHGGLDGGAGGLSMQSITGDLQHAGGIVSGAIHDVATDAGDANPEVAKFLKGPGVNENTTIRDTLQGAGAGAVKGAAVGAVFGFAEAGPPGAVVGAEGGFESGLVGGAVEGFGQGVFDTNKDYFEARDPGKNLPNWAKPSTDLRVGYQAFLKAAAGSVVGDYTADQLTPIDVGSSGGWEALNAINKVDARHSKAIQGQKVGEPIGPVFFGVAKFLKGPGVNENTTIRETLQGAGTGAVEGAAEGAVGGAVVLGPPGAAAGAAGGFESGLVGGAVEGFGQGVFDTNKAYFEARDPGKNLPNWAKPSTDLRVGYQGFLKAAAGTVVGDYTADQLTPIDVGSSGGWEALNAINKVDPRLSKAIQGQKVGEPIGPVFFGNDRNQVNGPLGTFFGGYGSSAPSHNGPVVDPYSFTTTSSPSPTPQYPPIYFPIVPPGSEDGEFGDGESQATDSTATP